MDTEDISISHDATWLCFTKTNTTLGQLYKPCYFEIIFRRIILVATFRFVLHNQLTMIEHSPDHLFISLILSVDFTASNQNNRSFNMR